MGEGALRRLGAGRVGLCRVGPVFDRSLRLVLAMVGVTTAAASSSSTTVRITMAPVDLSVTVLV
ncbi:hypothetical protein A6A27_40800 [Micromonospora sp. CB01531]|nr:hypothetical protein A6A27_40800 [Micromonospora sp. CB01531]